MTKAEFEKQVSKMMKTLDCTREEAEQIVADDNEVDRMSMKELSADMTAEQKKAVKDLSSVGQKTVKTTAKRERKPDDEKIKIIADLAKFAENFAENVEISNISKVIEFDLNGNHYKLDLIRQRKPKN